MLICTDPSCFALRRPVLPLGRDRAMHILWYHGGKEIKTIPEQVELDPDGSVGLAIIDRMLKFCEDFDKLLDKKPPYKPKFREPYLQMRAALVADVQALTKAAWEKACGNSSASSGAG